MLLSLLSDVTAFLSFILMLDAQGFSLLRQADILGVASLSLLAADDTLCILLVFLSHNKLAKRLLTSVFRCFKYKYLAMHFTFTNICERNGSSKELSLHTTNATSQFLEFLPS